ncbi:MAG: dihydrofolate reductase [Verrucomicrobium sp.]|nr:dihydrofolate reductase [Verrucomicrobium sp.]
MKLFKAIAAMAANRVIGLSGGGLPWHIPDEFKWFKEATLGQTLVMGRKTFETLPGALPGRKTVVVSRTVRELPGVDVVPSLDAVDPEAYPGEVFIAGGAEIYRAAFPRCGEIWLTILKRDAEGDVLFPPFEDQFRRAEILREHPEFTVYRYVRR